MRFKKIIKLFDQGNVCVTGLRGRGKDVLMGNVIARRKLPYVCNVDYHCKKSTFNRLQLQALDPLNDYTNFITGKYRKYVYPYEDKTDVYVSDAGIYFPSQYCSQLDKHFSGFSVYQAISRHLGDCNFHFNTQNLNRVWNKIREQSDIYIRCCWCKFIFKKIVVMKVIIYDKYQSAVDNVAPYKHISAPIFSKQEVRAQYKSKDEVLWRQFTNTYGTVKKGILVFKNKTNFDSRFIKKLLEG